MGLEPADLARWARFAAKGGIGKCTATCDCVAECPDDLMFLKNDEITVLLQLPEKEGFYLGYCEGVVGRFSGADVAFHSKLKKPVVTKRPSSNTTLSAHSISNLANSPTPTTPTTPTTLEAVTPSPSLPSRRIEDRSPSQSSLGHDSSTTGLVHSNSNIGSRNLNLDIRKSDGPQHMSPSPRGFHFSVFTLNGDGPGESSTTAAPSKLVSDDPTPSTAVTITSPSTPPPVSQLISSPKRKDSTTTTAPLRITKRSPSNPNSPAQHTFSPSSSSISTTPTFISENTSSSMSSDTMDDTSHESLVADTLPQSLDLQILESPSDDQAAPLSALPSALDTSATADSTFDDLATNHPGRFSHFSMGAALDIPALLGMAAQPGFRPPPVYEEPEDGGVTGRFSSLSRSSITSGRASLSIAARGKVDEATLASTQAQVGIGLSLLQDLVGGMSSDSESEYDDSDDECIATTDDVRLMKRRIERTSLAVRSGGTEIIDTAFAKSASGIESEASTSKEDDQELSVASHHISKGNTNEKSKITSSSKFSPPKSQYPEQHSASNYQPELFKRDWTRRPSVAPSVVSGVSGLSRKSGTSGSWEADIYDNYRDSAFSTGSAAPATRGPSIDSVRTESSGLTGRMRSESIGIIDQEVHAKASSRSPKATTTDSERRPSVDLNTSSYSQDSRLSLLAQEISSFALPVEGSSPSSRSATSSRPSPLSIATENNGTANESPLLHTNWPSPTSPSASEVQTALPPLTAGVYTPHPGRVDSEAAPTIGLSLPLVDATDDGKEGSRTDMARMASAMRQRLESERRSPFLEELQAKDAAAETGDDLSTTSHTSAGLGNGIVIEDDEELPSKILVDGEDYDDDDSTYEAMPGDFVVSTEPVQDSTKDEIHELERVTNGSPIPGYNPSHIASLVVSNRTPSPSPSRDAKLVNVSDSSLSAHPHPSNSPSPPEHVQPPLSQQSPPSVASQAQPTLEPPSQLRPRNNTNPSEPEGRKSLFLPHPNAPKAPVGAPLNAEPGAGVGVISHARQPSGPSHSSETGPRFVPHPPHQRPSVHAAIRMALSMPPRITQAVPGKQPIQIWPTIYGRTAIDLSTSIGPVPISFSVDPPPLSVTADRATAPGRAALPPIGTSSGNADTWNSPSRQRPATSHLPPPSSFSPLSDAGKPATRPSTSSAALPTSPVHNRFENMEAIKPDDKSASIIESKPNPTSSQTSATTNDATPIPRANFVPKVPGIRPRSRSFSGFNSSASQNTQLVPSQGAKHESTNFFPKRTVSSSTLSSLSKHQMKPSRPSPLSLSAVTSTNGSHKLPSSPLVRSTPTSPLAQHVFVPPSSTINLPSRFGSTSRRESNVTPPAPLQSMGSRSTLPHSFPNDAGTRPPQVSGISAALDATYDLASLDTTARPGPTVSMGPGINRQPSLRTKLSLPNLKKSSRLRDDDAVGVYDRDTLDRPKEVVQVQDTAFELVRPKIAVLQHQRSSEDSSVVRHENTAENAGPLQSEILSSPRSPIIDAQTLTMESRMASLSQSSESIEAHRQRELKWLSLMSSSPASLSRKSKKVKKLLLDGVPSSVRCLVWSYLTDGKGRAVKGVYEQLCQRGEVVRTRDISADSERLFGGDAANDSMHYLQATKGSVVTLLQAYFSMVPDVQYLTGLTKIVGQLLLLAPEEDAFWIFTSIMDTHIRSYFIPAPNSSLSSPPARSTQMEVDASLYSRALETIDPPLAKKIFVSLGILPGVVCLPWFTSLFVGALPLDYVNRVWDIFLYEGIPVLLRVALALTLACRKFILSSTTNTETITLAKLSRPPVQWLPSTPEAFLTTAMGVKLKDDDVRKQRIKMGEIIKRQTQVQQGATSVSQSGISLPRG